MNRSCCIDDPEVERATVSKAKGQLEPKTMKVADARSIVGWTHDAETTFNLDVRGHGFTISIGEVLVDGEMIVEPSDMSVLTRHLSLTHWLLNQSLHTSRFAVVAIPESRELRNRA